MAYSLTHTIPWTGVSTRHDAMVYLFDIALTGKSNTTVNAHPDGSPYKRSVKRTVDSWVTGADHDMYYWINWFSETNPTNVNMYVDATYTALPGDLGTNTRAGTVIYLSSNGSYPANGAFQFWESDTSDGVLMTQDQTVIFWEAGVKEGMFYPDPLWDGTGLTKASGYFPYNNGSAVQKMAGAYPVKSSLPSTSCNMHILIEHGSPGTRPTGFGELVTSPPVGYGSTVSTLYPDTAAAFAFFLPNDTAYYFPSGGGNRDRYWGSTATGMANVLYSTDNSRYYILFNSAGGVAIDCGTTEPLLT